MYKELVVLFAFPMKEACVTLQINIGNSNIVGNWGKVETQKKSLQNPVLYIFSNIFKFAHNLFLPVLIFLILTAYLNQLSPQ